jgi:hypothetical protein
MKDELRRKEERARNEKKPTIPIICLWEGCCCGWSGLSHEPAAKRRCKAQRNFIEELTESNTKNIS